MKKKVIIILAFNLFSLCISQLIGQCDNYLEKIDLELSKKNRFINGVDYWFEQNPTENCENSVLEHYSKIGFIGDSLEFSIQNILKNFIRNGNSLEIKQKALNLYLDKCYAFDISLDYQWSKDTFDKQAPVRRRQSLRRS